MRKTMSMIALKLARKLNPEIRQQSQPVVKMPVELSIAEREIIDDVIAGGYTMTSVPRLVATLKACRHVVEQDIDGDFVECGVWRGGNAILAKKVFELLGSKKQVFLFDTFEGMTKPTLHDRKTGTAELAFEKYEATQSNGHSQWCYASLEDVRENFIQSRVDLGNVHFIKGDVAVTLNEGSNVPDKIAVLRLDTDWYESTLVELEILYPRLTVGGAILIDDYGHWEGARKAVDEYFENNTNAPLLYVTDYTGRMGVKVGS
ncbi:TylF/MycF/NovP-related O-methyltransferase [Roseibium polysiphoniae]|uniref:Class I SAM-dependent methyltransferase n=1 Tax=Roseibium polysiphoniae TaxID=2571221 RepID=A0ABR9C7Z3_9HYPH|nr:TylF/MycF/NovP-related O-methyltransferase [Roseibium polysiphoniae]MBD8876015.1 class I SAM-dependent methyltransferase [Roseibium polysiphoniae]